MARSLPSTIGGVTVVDITLAASGGTVSTLQGAWEWIYANYPNLVSANVIVRVLVTGTINQTASSITIGGNITTDATRYVIFAANLGQGLCDQDPATTPIRYNTSYAGFASSTSVNIPAFTIPSTVTGKVAVEGLQFRYNSVGDGNAVVIHSGIDWYSRSCMYIHARSGVAGMCLKYEKSARSYNDIFLSETSSYIDGFTPVTATTAAHISEIHNATYWSPSSSNLGLGFNNNDNAATGSKAYNVLKINSYDTSGINAKWDPRGIATTNTGTSGSGGYVNIVAADTIVAPADPYDLRLKSTSAMKTGGYNNLADNPLDFFYRLRVNQNIGVFDPDASSGDNPPTITIDDFYASGPDLVIEYSHTSEGTSPEITAYLERDGIPVTPEPTTTSLTGTFVVSDPGAGEYVLELLEISDSIGSASDGPASNSVEIIGLGGTEIEASVDKTLNSILIVATATIQGGINGEVNETLGNLTVISEAVINTQITGTLSKTLKNATLKSTGYVGEVPPPPSTGYTIGGPYLTLNINLTVT